jgi:hypothetical protein
MTGLIGIYYSIETDRFSIRPSFAVPEIPGVGRLVTDELVREFESQIKQALVTVGGAGGGEREEARNRQLGEAVAKFYRVRACLETDGASEGITVAERYCDDLIVCERPWGLRVTLVEAPRVSRTRRPVSGKALPGMGGQ